jgi:hypothetical protein
MSNLNIEDCWKKPFSALNSEEKIYISDFCSSEEEYIQFQKAMNSFENYVDNQKESPSENVKEKLDSLFYYKHQRKGVLWYNSLSISLYPKEKSFFNRPLIKFAAIFLLLIALYPIWKMGASRENVQLAENKMIKTEDLKTEFEKEVEAELKTEETLMKSKKQANQFTQNSDESFIPSPNERLKMKEPLPKVSNEITIESMVGTTVHPDGIYQAHTSKSNQTFKLQDNLEILDLIVPIF